jgi:serine phosphatase RsbU (regulator of sigma subunit)
MFFWRKKKPVVHERASGEAHSESRADVLAPAPRREEMASGPPSTQFLTGEAGKDRRTVQVLLEAIARVSESRDLEALLMDIVDRSIELTGAERGLLLLRQGEQSDLVVRIGRLRGKRPLNEDARFSTSIAIKVLSEVQALRATVHSESEALELGRSVYDLKLRAVMCVPLAPPSASAPAGAAGVKGVLYVDSRAATRQFGQGDLALFAALAQHISIALENARLHFDSIEKLRLEQSLELASAIQRDLMPRVPKNLPGWDVHGWYGPAERTGGDFYDFVPVKGGRLGIVIGDATGHGIGPALITATAQASLRSTLRLVDDAGEVVTLLNEDLCERVEDGRFLTLFLALLDEQGRLDALNAGHPPALLWRRANDAIEAIPLNGPALGMLSGEHYSTHPTRSLAPGDLLLLYTDGLTEARPSDGERRMLGEEGVRATLSAAGRAGLSAKDAALKLVEAAMSLSGGVKEDDLTVVVARRL